ncbi:MAG: 3-carboxyethylcatechol 2,3-dioxygenase [Proteobacteria bacterium]|jgi:2,3-dihydroxyphenylpropionate 1,2-dioxygenase|nr:3-carboxyethylcatechol 2,3-dioxygenase [Pseudomonadota bacterium]MBT6192892.1 3-carboxyethylcatechol 2,3-dioxygenase [Pseudomonadota bacterium]MBT6465114.1 3-carboxyethylcatechol 2,3-dioxygenase [Pseudomonadota bacterium]MBT7246257.1 3-carboxyethylcatechol 2,3-dioxygenase [Pseudomonadota bacterium]MBT7625940.1 3-carboxyethylcatechol 2,3-dioxygenase [Pseudomonadota bacterium]
MKFTWASFRDTDRVIVPIRFAFASHTPLKGYCKVPVDVSEAVEAAHLSLRDWVDAYDPELVIALGPDHFNGFFYNVMPPFCIGMESEAVGDWNTPAGHLRSAQEIALNLLSFAHKSGVDLAASYSMKIDHGLSQFLNELFTWDSMPPVIPVFLNCAAPPRPPLQRVLELGRLIGVFAKTLDLRILVTASGGLSHDPPIPLLSEATGELRNRLIHGGKLSAEARESRQNRVVEEANKQIQGVSVRIPLNPEWDRSFIESIQRFDFDPILSMNDEQMTNDAGCGVHEVRTWLSVAAAAQESGAKSLELLLYLPIPEWVAGYAIMKGVGADY